MNLNYLLIPIRKGDTTYLIRTENSNGISYTLNPDGTYDLSLRDSSGTFNIKGIDSSEFHAFLSRYESALKHFFKLKYVEKVKGK